MDAADHLVLPPFPVFLDWLRRQPADRLFLDLHYLPLQCGVACFLTEFHGGRAVRVYSTHAFFHDCADKLVQEDAVTYLPPLYAAAVQMFDDLGSNPEPVSAGSWAGALTSRLSQHPAEGYP